MIIIALAFVFLRLPNFTLVDHNWSDINLYKMLAERIAAGQMPYIDFTLEYPPFALIFFVVPALVASIFGDFDLSYRLFMMLFDIGCLLLVGEIVKLLAPGRNRMIIFAQAAYLVLTAISFQVLYDRFDIAVAFLILLAVYLAIREKWLWAYIVIILGAFAKLFPALLLPLLVIHQARRDRASGVIKDFGIAVAAGLVLLIVSIAIFGDWWGYMLEYHGRRGIQIESLYSSIAMLARYAGAKATVGHEYGAFQITNAFSELMTRASMFLMGGAILAVYVVFWRKTKKAKDIDRRFLLAALLALTSFALFNKVLSPQFFLWLFPLVSVALAVSPRKAVIAALWLLIAVLTTLIFPYSYRSLIVLGGAAGFAIARNLMLLIAAVLIFRILGGRPEIGHPAPLH